MIATLSVVSTLALLQAAPPPPGRETPLQDVVTLSLSADRETYYRGERIKLHVSADNVSDQPVEGDFELDPRLDLRFFFKGPRMPEPARLRCFVPLRGSAAISRRTLQVGGGMRKAFYLSVKSLELPWRFILDEPGEYEFTVVYHGVPGNPNEILESNVVRVEVVPAPPAEQAAEAAYTPFLALVPHVGIEHRCSLALSPERLVEAATFLERFPQSRYSEPLKAGLLNILECGVRQGRASQEERELLERLRHTDGDTKPPYLLVDVTPAVLWPPNHKMVGVKVKVAAQDETDPAPEVKLVSITCDDGCDPVLDIDGAILDSDDRDFELRAERLGPGKGRTYTITYSATDNAGNVANATATVVVPHDQGEGGR